MTVAVSFAPEASGTAKRPRFNHDPRTVYEGGVAPAGFMTPVGLAAKSRVGSVTSGSATVTIADTSGLAVGDIVIGAGCSAAQAVTTVDTNDLFGLTAHGIPAGTPIWLESIATTTGITAGRRYFAITTGTGADVDHIKLANTPGGSAIAITTNGTAVIRVQRFITAISENASITLSAIASATAAATTLEFVGPVFFAT